MAQEIVDTAREKAVPFKDSEFGRLQHTVEAAQNDEGKDDVGIFKRIVVAAKQISHAPDEVDFGLEVLHRSSGCNASSDLEHVRASQHSMRDDKGDTLADVVAAPT
jgi:hypothetical protein